VPQGRAAPDQPAQTGGPSRVDCVLDVHHGSQADQMETALLALRSKRVVTIVDLPGGGAVARTRERATRVGAGRPRSVAGAIVTLALRQRKRASVASTVRSTSPRVATRASMNRYGGDDDQPSSRWSRLRHEQRHYPGSASRVIPAPARRDAGLPDSRCTATEAASSHPDREAA
jgi:hypothetical protein